MVDKRENALKKENLLSSWKEIASYLDCDVRTCLRWEKDLGLPVQRLGESPRTRVFAYKEDLDQWMADRANNNNSAWTDSPSIPKLPIPLGWRITILASTVLAIMIAAYLLFFHDFQSVKSLEQQRLKESGATGSQPGPIADDQPADFKIDGAILIITNKAGRELFRFDTELDDLKTEEYYRDHFQIKKRDFSEEWYSILFPQLIIKDINGNGAKEILFVPQTQLRMDENILYCFNKNGGIEWQFKAGQRLTFGEIQYANHYSIERIWFERLEGQDGGRIFAISSHRQNFPTQLVMLDSTGQNLGEYWNSGRMDNLCFADLDFDGKTEILVAAMNNEFGAPCLIVFDQDQIRGSSPQKEEFFKSNELDAGKEKYYVRFPLEEQIIYPDLMESLSQLETRENSTIKTLTKGSYIEYYFGFDLNIKNVRLTHRYREYYGQRVEENRITEPFKYDKIAERLKKGLRYWDGDDWVSTPTMTKYWRNLK